MRALNKFILLCTIAFLFAKQSFSQDNQIDSLKNALASMKPDTMRVNTLILLSRKYLGTSPAEVKKYSEEALREKNNQK